MPPGRRPATPKPMTLPMTAVPTVAPTCRTRLVVAVIAPISLRATPLCTTASTRLMKQPVPRPTTAMPEMPSR